MKIRENLKDQGNPKRSFNSMPPPLFYSGGEAEDGGGSIDVSQYIQSIPVGHGRLLLFSDALLANSHTPHDFCCWVGTWKVGNLDGEIPQ
jgi:hypothetical protein